MFYFAATRLLLSNALVYLDLVRLWCSDPGELQLYIIYVLDVRVGGV